MVQTWTDDVYGGSHAAATDLQNMENNFASLKTLFAGGAQPANRVGGMPWFDTANDVLKYRDEGDANWWVLLHGDPSQKFWVYRNSAMIGWVIDSSVTDRVLALKGGSTYTTGGAVAGTWQQVGAALSIAHMPSHNHSGGSASSAGAHTHNVQGAGNIGTGTPGFEWRASGPDDDHLTDSNGSHSHTITVNSQGSGSAHNHGSSWRPAAATGTLQYPDG